jgi:c-di-GMP-related signal transduction protein
MPQTPTDDDSTAVQNPALVARQAIYDRAQDVVGYELLFRQQESDDCAVISDRDTASTSVILDTFLNIGLDQIVGSSPAFLNLTRNFFLGAQKLPFPKERVVLEVLEGELIDPPLVEAVRAYSAAGYRIALDDFVYRADYDPLLDLADIVKIDVLELAPREVEEQLRLVAPYDVVLLAEKVETHEHFAYCRDLGFDLYQGFFLNRPKVVTGYRIPANRMATLRLLAKLQDPNVQLDRLEQVIREDLSLSYKLLRLINSAFYALPQRIESIRQTLVLLGLQQIRSWVSLLTLSALEDKPSELTVTAMVRAKMAERMCEEAGQFNTDVAFTVGLFSTLDAMLDMPMDEILETLGLAEGLAAALTAEHSGSLGEVLECVLAYERGDWDRVSYRNLDLHQIRVCYLDAIEWAHGAGRELGI